MPDTVPGMRTGLTPFRLALALLSVVAALAVGWLFATHRGHEAGLLPDRVMTPFAAPQALAPFALIDHERRAFDLARLRGRWSFLFFGFTHCPDVCPTTLATLAHLRRELGDVEAQVVFVSVDPARDDAARLKRYTSAFDAGFIGVTGPAAELHALARQLDVAYRADAAAGEDYPVVHSAAVFLVDPQARYHARFTPPFDARAIGARFRALRALAAARAT